MHADLISFIKYKLFLLLIFFPQHWRNFNWIFFTVGIWEPCIYWVITCSREVNCRILSSSSSFYLLWLPIFHLLSKTRHLERIHPPSCLCGAVHEISDHWEDCKKKTKTNKPILTGIICHHTRITDSKTIKNFWRIRCEIGTKTNFTWKEKNIREIGQAQLNSTWKIQLSTGNWATFCC